MFYDLAIIGGGAAGMMAAITAGKLGAKVVLIEKNSLLGRKILISGKGRCNVTQGQVSGKSLIEKYGKNGRFLHKALNNFSPTDVIDFFESNGLKTKVERGGRVFPVSDSAGAVVAVLEKCLRQNGVEISLKTTVKKIVVHEKQIKKIITSRGEIQAENFLVTTGGKTYPDTGSTGDGFAWANKLGHTVIKPKPVLVPVKITKIFSSEDSLFIHPRDLQGVSLKNVELKLINKNEKRFGEMIFTHFGVSGPIVLDLSQEVGEALELKSKKKMKQVVLSLDLKPALDSKKLDERIRRDFEKYRQKLFKNSLSDLLPQKMILVVIKLSKIDPEKKVNQISKIERLRLAKLLKDLRMEVTGLMDFSMAIVTAGGISLKEVDPSSMRSKIIPNLFFAGEVLDINGPTGGYNLQAAWSTGHLAGKKAV